LTNRSLRASSSGSSPKFATTGRFITLRCGIVCHGLSVG
jgi:hypothetical protein